MMHYIEDTTPIIKTVPQDDRLLILDGTTCLDYLADEQDLIDNKSWLQKFFDYLTSLFKF
jgi:hypothetical protein